jgi:hypothetical protein
MKVGDSVHFVSPDGKVQSFVSPQKCSDKLGRSITDLTPFGTGPQAVRGPRSVYPVVNSCKARLSCMVLDKKKVLRGYDGVVRGAVPRLSDDDNGASICTGGKGNSQVNC